MGKAIRDHILGPIRMNCGKSASRQLRDDEDLDALTSKLIEKAEILHLAERDDWIGEAADVYEVPHAIATAPDVKKDDFKNRAE